MPARPSSLGPEPETSIIRSTLRALLEPRRLLPILLVCVSLVVAQGSFSSDPLAVPLGVLMCALFVVVAPVSWRVLFPHGVDLRHGGIRLLLYLTIAAGVVLSLGVGIPKVFGIGHTLLTAPSTVAASLALFVAGGWGLGRDIGLTSSLARAEARAAALERDAEQAQLLALRSHLDPHFLFNTLGAIAEWCREDGEAAERAILQLASMLRTVLAGARAATWPLGEEVALIEALFALHRLRDPDRIRLAWRLPDPLPHAELPPMVLLPLAENAVKHGPYAGHRGEIVFEIRALAGGDRLAITLSNPGPFRGRRPGGSGLEIVERRLALAYDGEAMLKIATSDDGAATVAEVTLPRVAPRGRGPT
jgi:two-component system, LytTR family, sensor histidine kinase AlgZ